MHIALFVYLQNVSKQENKAKHWIHKIISGVMAPTFTGRYGAGFHFDFFLPPLPWCPAIRQQTRKTVVLGGGVVTKAYPCADGVTSTCG